MLSGGTAGQEEFAFLQSTCRADEIVHCKATVVTMALDRERLGPAGWEIVEGKVAPETEALPLAAGDAIGIVGRMCGSGRVDCGA